VIVDAGIPAYRVSEGLVRARVEPDDVAAILITHEHSDHVKGLQAVANRLDGASVFASGGSWEGLGFAGGGAGRSRVSIKIQESRREIFNAGDSFTVGDIHIVSVALDHDAAEPSGYVLSAVPHGGSVAIITDTGIFTKDHASKTADADILVIEANHDVEMLLQGRYPAHLKQRILSDHGHLSNEASAAAILDIMALEKKERCILLAHLSAENNTPAKAEQTVAAALAEEGFYSGRDLYLKALMRDRMSVVFEI
jgi:phosphoribosyl 1,2-cyclic phosphodiesterase